MSTTNDLDKAMRICAIYRLKGHTGIEFLIIDTTGAEWDQVKMYDVKKLLKCLNLPILGTKTYLEKDFLVENEVPSSCVVRKSLSDFKSQCSKEQRCRMDYWFEQMGKVIGRKRKRRADAQHSEKKHTRTYKLRKVDH